MICCINRISIELLHHDYQVWRIFALDLQSISVTKIIRNRLNRTCQNNFHCSIKPVGNVRVIRILLAIKIINHILFTRSFEQD